MRGIGIGPVGDLQPDWVLGLRERKVEAAKWKGSAGGGLSLSKPQYALPRAPHVVILSRLTARQAGDFDHQFTSITASSTKTPLPSA